MGRCNDYECISYSFQISGFGFGLGWGVWYRYIHPYGLWTRAPP
jgi:hypothetical protein